MSECVRCGHDNLRDAAACRDCAWPLALDAWRGSHHQIRRMSLDTGCVNAKRANPHLNLLERWADEGHITLERSGAFLAELKGYLRRRKAEAIAPHRPVWRLGVPGLSELGINTFLAGPDLGHEVAPVLFPTAAILTSNQAADVEHLRQHVITGADVFVTLNERDFIRRGKQDRLRRHGIWVLTPQGATQLLGELYGWDA